VKIFVDTNIFLDILFKRNDYMASHAVFKSVKNTIFTGFVADITIVNIDYISRKIDTDIKAYLLLIEKNFNIVGADNNIVKDALNILNSDIEDNLQYVIALKEECDCIISNDKSFYKNEIAVYSSSVFVDKFLK
jgi:predicted nucleic acid-binding protein